jgi:hypothetical protein
MAILIEGYGEGSNAIGKSDTVRARGTDSPHKMYKPLGLWEPISFLPTYTSRPQYPSWRPPSSPLHLWTIASVPTYRVPDGSGWVIDMIPSGTKLQVTLVAEGNWVQVTWGDRDGTNQVRWINTGSRGVTTIPSQEGGRLPSSVPTPLQGIPSPSTEPRPSLSSAEEIHLAKVGGVYELPVEINGVLTLNFVVDSGAAEVNIPADVVLTLVRTGTIKDSDFLPGTTYILADGSQLSSPRFLIRSLKIGHQSLTNVSASVGPTGGKLRYEAISSHAFTDQMFDAGGTSWTLCRLCLEPALCAFIRGCEPCKSGTKARECQRRMVKRKPPYPYCRPSHVPSCGSHCEICTGWTPYSDANSFTVFSPRMAASATRALNSPLCCRLF